MKQTDHNLTTEIEILIEKLAELKKENEREGISAEDVTELRARMRTLSAYIEG